MTALLARLTDEDRALLGSLQEERTVPAGTVLFRQGDPADAALFVQSGRLELALHAPGRAEPVDVVASGAGDLIGEPALLGRATRGRSARAVDATTVGWVHRSDLQALLLAFHPASLRIVRAVAEHVALRMSAPGEGRAPGAFDGGRPSVLDPRPFLPMFPFFERFTAGDVEALLAHGTLWDVPRGAQLVRAGTQAQRCFLVLRGAAEVCVDDVRIGLIGPGRPVGEMALLTGRPAAADVRVREAGTVLELGQQAFDVLTRPPERVAFKFTHALAASLMHTMARTNRHRAREALTAHGVDPWPT